MGITKAERERRAEESIISTICGNTTAYDKKASTEWVALASGTHSVEQVKKVAEKFGMKCTEKEIDLSNKSNMSKEYGTIVKRRLKELEERQKKIKERNRLKAKQQKAKKERK